MTVNEAKRILPHLMPLRFHEEHNAAIEDREAESEMVQDMLDLDGWEFLGWTYAENVSSGGKPFTFFCMFQQSNTRVWCHISEGNFMRLASHFWRPRMPERTTA